MLTDIPGEDGSEVGEKPLRRVKTEDTDDIEWLESEREKSLRHRDALAVVLQKSPTALFPVAIAHYVRIQTVCTILRITVLMERKNGVLRIQGHRQDFGSRGKHSTKIY